MRKILLIDDGKAVPLNETTMPLEVKLQDYLEQYPALIPLADVVEEASDLLCIGNEVNAGTGFIDLLCVDKDGLLTIIETKLRKNSEARREVVGQIIEYASYVSQWTADEIYGIANDYFIKSEIAPEVYRGKALDEVMVDIVGVDFSDDDFRNRIEQNLKDGRMRLIIAMDELIEQLRSTVTFLNSNSSFDILILQVTDFEESTSKRVLVPMLFGYTTKTAKKGRWETKRWNEDSFLEDVKDSCAPDVADTAKKLCRFIKDNADEAEWGKGKTGSFTFRKRMPGQLITIFGILSNGTGWISFGQLLTKGIKEEVALTFRARLSEIPGINLPQDAVRRDSYPSIEIETLIKEDNLKNFQDAVIHLCQQIENE